MGKGLKAHIEGLNNELNQLLPQGSVNGFQNDLSGIVRNFDSSWQSDKGNMFRDRINKQVCDLQEAADEAKRQYGKLVGVITTVEIVEHLQKSKKPF